MTEDAAELRARRAEFDKNAPKCAEQTCTTKAYYGMRGLCATHYRRWKLGLPMETVKESVVDPYRVLSAHEVAMRYGRVFETWNKPIAESTATRAMKPEPHNALEKSRKPVIWDLHYKYTMGIGLDVAAPSPDSGERWEAYQKWLPIQRQVQARRKSAQKLIAPEWRSA